MPDINNLHIQIDNAIEAAAKNYELAWIRYSEDNLWDSNRNMDPQQAVAAFHSTLNQLLNPLNLDQSAALAAFSAAQSRLTTLRRAKTNSTSQQA